MKPTELFNSKILLLLVLVIPQVASSQNSNSSGEHPQDEWKYLFDGVSLQGWKSYNEEGLKGNWTVGNGELRADGTGGDIISREQYSDFELYFEWKISRGGNSGVFYHVKESEEFPKVWHTGIEMQIMDNKNNAMGDTPLKNAASLYAMYAADKDMTLPAGEWNSSRIIVRQGEVEYWMNGERVNRYVLWNEKWYDDRESTIHHKGRKPLWGEFRKGHIALQDEGFPVSYRNIKIKEISSESRKPGGSNFVPATYLDENNPKQREGHYVQYLINEWHGSTNGFNSIFAVYTSKDFVITGMHEDQEMFFVVEGMGWALIGDKEIPVYPGACWLVPPNTMHGIKCAETSEGIKVFVVHGAP
jgi:mannose-6-phosphate isomerase-like protein (cupin superfamily)